MRDVNKTGSESDEPHVVRAPLTNDQLVSIWSKAVDTQMHFNEMSVKSRQLGLTFVAAALGVAVVMISQGRDFSLPITLGGYDLRIHVAVLLVLAALAAVLAVRRLDLGVYHRMLRGAVTFGEDLEESHLKDLFGLQKGMTQAISHFSRHSDAKVIRVSGSAYKYEGCNLKSAEKKIRGFYVMVVLFLIVGALVLLVVTNFDSTDSTPTTTTEQPEQTE
jgi:hypothetical protein